MNQHSSTYPIERLISALSYVTLGMAGFFWLIAAAVMKKTIRPFLMFNILQSIFLSFAYFIFTQLYKIILIAFYKIPLINSFVFMINNIINSPLSLLSGLTLLQAICWTVIIYLVVTSLMGKYSYIPYVSDIIKGNTGY